MQQKRGIEQYRNGFQFTLAKQRLHDPYSWRDPKVVFVNSMSDIFHEEMSVGYLTEIFEVMAKTPKHTYQLLTKRVNRLQELSEKLNWTDNIWLGVSVESSKWINRIDLLKKTSAKVKFISFEPLIDDIVGLNLDGIDWVIVGGESGALARPMREEWVKSLRDECKRKNVHFFFKQWGKREFNPNQLDPTIDKFHKNHSKGGSQVDGKLLREFPR